MDINDSFDEIAQWEEQLIAQGEEMGHEQGKVLGVEEGKELGIIKGTEIGSEVGFYCGCYLTWKSMLENETHKRQISDRAAKSIVSLGVLLQAFPLKNIVDEDIMHQLLTIRAKFKVITSLLGLQGTLVFNPNEIHAHKNMSF